MADLQSKTYTFTATKTNIRDTYFSTATMRDLVFAVEVSAAASTGSDTLTVTIQDSNSDSGNFSTANDNYWQTFYAFATIAGNATVPYYTAADMSQALTSSSTTNVKRSIGKWCRIKLAFNDASGSALYTGNVRISWNTATTTT